jgi:hypothetical protein
MPASEPGKVVGLTVRATDCTGSNPVCSYGPHEVHVRGHGVELLLIAPSTEALSTKTPPDRETAC